MTPNRPLIALGFLAALNGAAVACGPEALGVYREIKVGAPTHVGLKTYPQTLDLKDHEVVLTFDDGPAPTTRRVLAALEAECAKATFFLIGRNAAAMTDVVRREIADGDTVGHHSNSHPMLRSLRLDAAVTDIDKGVASVHAAAGGKDSNFFRFPYFADSPYLLAEIDKKNMPVFGADLWASDWNVMTPHEELDLLMGRLRRAGGGIVLLHDTHKQTADMIPDLLKALKAEGFHLVHIVPGDSVPPLKKAPDGWTSETEATLRKMGKTSAAKREKAAPAPMGGAPVQDKKDDGAPKP